MADEEIHAAWDNQNDYDNDAVSDGGNEYKQEFMSKIDKEIDFDARYENAGYIELTAASPKYSYCRFAFIYFFLSLAEQFGFYWITLYGSVKYGYQEWLDRYIIALAIAAFISSITSSIIGRLSDRVGRKYIILISILIQSLPYIPLIIFPDKIEYFLYSLPIIGVCGSIATLTGVMKSYIVDILPKRFLISGFAKILSIYAGAGILSSMMIYTIIGNDVRNFFYDDDFVTFTTEIIMGITVGLYMFTVCLVACIPESLTQEMRLNYPKFHPCHGIYYVLTNSVIIYTMLFIFFCTFALYGMMAVIDAIFLIDFTFENYDLVSINDTGGSSLSSGNNVDVLGDDLLVYGAFLFTLGCTLICAPCCIYCCCGKAIANMLCSMILMTISFGMIIFLLFSNEWYTFCIAFICGILFAMGQIGFAFLDGSIAKFINSKQYGIAYGILHSIHSLAKAIAPYTFWILFEYFTKDDLPVESVLGKAKSVIYIGCILAIIGISIGLCAVKTSMNKYKQSNENKNNADHEIEMHHRHSYHPGEDPWQNKPQIHQPSMQYDNEQDLGRSIASSPRRSVAGGLSAAGRDRAPSAPNEDEMNFEMQPPPQRPPPQADSVQSSNYVVGQMAPAYASNPYVPQQANQQAQFVVMQQQQQPQQMQQYYSPQPQQQQLRAQAYGDLPSQSYSGQAYAQSPQQAQMRQFNYGQQQVAMSMSPHSARYQQQNPYQFNAPVYPQSDVV